MLRRIVDGHLMMRQELVTVLESIVVCDRKLTADCCCACSRLSGPAAGRPAPCRHIHTKVLLLTASSTSTTTAVSVQLFCDPGLSVERLMSKGGRYSAPSSSLRSEPGASARFRATEYLDARQHQSLAQRSVKMLQRRRWVLLQSMLSSQDTCCTRERARRSPIMMQ